MSNIEVQKVHEHEGYLREKQILKLLPVSRATFRRRIKKGIWPAGVKDDGIRVWTKADIQLLLKRVEAGVKGSWGGAA